ncbi:Alkaline phosphatase synthesis sensor protein PhoR [Gimesia panareensis]|uniref:histidine kinase n=1 Tax=Gimesia panareensis TaxID=2527978 RepID=A0A517QGN6_9PLAN|nr:HAMP domain-containing sensor histidine kinase [Gimesia panareensis]QDT30765.1 Alkaline phosphatase synthesis sensor protein PhoR [Gimesia panareensis]
MKSYGKYWFLVMLLLFMSCADNLLVTSQIASPMLALAASLTASLVGWAWLVKSIQKDRNQISACLRNPELLRTELKRKNFFGNLLAEAIQKIEESDTELVSTTQVKTMLKARLNSLAKKETLMESVLNHLPTGVLVFDAQHALEYSNQAATPFLIPEADRNLDTSDSSLALSKALRNEVVIPEIAGLLKKTIERKDATSSRRCEFALTGLDFDSHFRAIATNLFDENQALLGTVIVVENIGEENNEKERHAEFVSSVAHELKTPMAGIKAYVEMLLDGDCEPDEAEELYGFINEQIDRLTRLVNSMLNLARIESGVVEIKRHDCELNDILKSASDVISPNATEKDITFTAELSELYLPVYVDKDMLGQAIINLLSNAVKYTPHGHEVRLRSRMEDNTAVIEVRDTGMGIPENSLPHIFDRFYRVPENNRSAAGTGLGLALVHFIVTNVHNGSISVQSVVNEGTCFTVTIPLGHKDHKKKKALASPVTV